jgi:hypothetical protein
MVGQFESNATFVSLHGSDGIRFSEQSRNYQDSDHIRRWIVIRSLDRIRRTLLGELESPVDWN